MRKHPLVTNQYYHIYNRGVDKRDIFSDKKDLNRFILSIKQFNKIYPVGSIRDNVRDKIVSKYLKRRGKDADALVSIVCFCLNPNHFHFILKQEADGGISEFLKRLLGGYTKYFNLTHKRSGALFQGRFKSRLIDSEQYFLKIFPYVNINHMIHDIPEEKRFLVSSSDVEYEKMVFDIVSKKEAENLLAFYGNKNNFKNECLKVSSIIREQREEVSSFLEEE
ncbi:MAG: transposase [Candidatus Pacebacteria bacterium]|nr:transposase [Candidatus Paceibacterota bacterium]